MFAGIGLAGRFGISTHRHTAILVYGERTRQEVSAARRLACLQRATYIIHRIFDHWYYRNGWRSHGLSSASLEIGKLWHFLLLRTLLNGSDAKPIFPLKNEFSLFPGGETGFASTTNHPRRVQEQTRELFRHFPLFGPKSSTHFSNATIDLDQ